MHTWYSYDPERGYETWMTAAEAEKDADACLEHFRDKSSDGWHEDVASIEWGLLVPYGEARQIDQKDAEPGSDFDYVCDYTMAAAPGDDPLERACRQFERSTDWYQQRFDALRKWVKEEVAPLSKEVAGRYFSIVANGSAAPHESADWRNTMHGLTVRAEQAERERDDYLAEIERLHARIEETAASHVRSLRLAQASARQEGAEAMRALAAQLIGCGIDGCPCDDRMRSEFILDLPLPGEEKP